MRDLSVFNCIDPGLADQCSSCHSCDLTTSETDIHQHFLIRTEEISHQVFLVHLQDGRVGCDLVEHNSNQWQIVAVGLHQFLSTGIEICLQPLLAVVKMSVFILDHTFSDLAGEGIRHRNVDVVG